VEDAIEELPPAPLLLLAFGSRSEAQGLIAVLDSQGLKLGPWSLHVDRKERLATVDRRDLPGRLGLAAWSPILYEPLKVVVRTGMLSRASPFLVSALIVPGVDFVQKRVHDTLFRIVMQEEITSEEHGQNRPPCDENTLDDATAMFFLYAICLQIAAHKISF
jgi:hypothetical protein